VLVDALSATLRALSFVALFQAAGMAIFFALFGRQLTRTRDVLCRIGIVSATGAAALVVLHYMLEAARMSGEIAGMLDGSLQSLVLHSSAGTALALRLAGLALILIGFFRRDSTAAVPGLIGVTLALLAFTTVGHTTTHAPRGVLAMLLLVHLTVAAFWFGALVPLLVVNAREPASIVASLVERFSALAVWLVPGLFIAGVLLAGVLLGSFAALGSGYGTVLLVKVAGFTALMALAALNKWRFGPALTRGDARIRHAFQRSLLAEYALIVAIFCVTAVLTSFYSPEG
jgi:putative copper export protein